MANAACTARPAMGCTDRVLLAIFGRLAVDG